MTNTTGALHPDDRDAHPGDPEARHADFEPVVGATAAPFAHPGEPFIERLAFGIQHGARTAGIIPHRTTTDAFLPVVAEGTVYGPFRQRPVESAEVPDDAPVAGTATVIATEGLATSYTATSDAIASASGFYTWVWTIDASRQPPATASLLPADYSFHDAFGQIAETSIVPSRIVGSTRVLTPEVAVNGVSHDSLEVSSDGFWLQREGTNIPVVFRGTAYFVAGTTAPAVSDDVPADAVALGSVTIEVDGPGEYRPHGVTAPAIAVGFITWVWEIRAEDQHPDVAGWVEPWADRFGLPAETQLIAQPTATTQAQAGGGTTATIHDIATVDGAITVGRADLSIAAFRTPATERGRIARASTASEHRGAA